MDGDRVWVEGANVVKRHQKPNPNKGLQGGIVEKNRELYHKRRDVLVEAFGRAGWDIPAPRASMFA